MTRRKREPLHISARTAEIYNRRDAADAMRNIGISPMEENFSLEKSAARIDYLEKLAQAIALFAARIRSTRRPLHLFRSEVEEKFGSVIAKEAEERINKAI